MNPFRTLSVCAFSGLLIGVTIISAAQPATAHGSYTTTWSGRYPSSTTLTNVTAGTGQSCALCHFTVGGGSNWNAYGWKMRQNIQGGQSLLNAIINAENFNSDIDPTTATNVFEINANSQPGWTPGAVNTEYFSSSTTPNLSPPAAIQGSLDPLIPVPFCFGDSATDCPCSGAGGSGIPNPGLSGHGCANTTFPGGAQLSASGNAVNNVNDTLVLTCSNMSGPGLFFQSNSNGTLLNFGDGKLCASVGIIRMGVVFPTGGVGSYPGGLTPNPIHIAGAPILSPTATKDYQCWYRDITVGFCNPAGYNTSNALAVTWAP